MLKEAEAIFRCCITKHEDVFLMLGPKVTPLNALVVFPRGLRGVQYSSGKQNYTLELHAVLCNMS